MTRIALAIAAAHPAFAGHFPSRPIVPGVVLLDESLRAIASHFGIDQDGPSSAVCSIGAAKFLSAVGPGEPVWIEVEPTAPAPGAPATAGKRYALRAFAGSGASIRLAVTATLAFEARAGNAGPRRA